MQLAELLESCERLAARAGPELSRAAASLRGDVSREAPERQHAAQASVLQACLTAQALGALLFDAARLLSTTTVVSCELPPGSTVGGPRGPPVSRATPGVWHRGQPLLITPAGGLHQLPPSSTVVAPRPPPQAAFFGSALAPFAIVLRPARPRSRLARGVSACSRENTHSSFHSFRLFPSCCPHIRSAS